MSSVVRPGFRLPELLIILTGLLFLTCLGVIAVVQVREAADRINCQNNLHQIMIAAHNVHDSNGFIPSNPDTRGERFGTLQYYLLPYME